MLFRNRNYKKFILNTLPLTYVLTVIIYIFFSSVLFKYAKLNLEAISVIMVFFGICGLIIYIINKSVNKVKFDFFDFLILLLTVFGIIATIFAINKGTSLMGFVGRYEGLLQIFFYYMLFLNCKSIDNIKSKKKIVNIILAIISIQSIYAILQFFDFKNIFGIEIIRNRYYSTSFQNNPNFFASLMVIGFSISISLYFFNNKSKFDYKYLILSFLIFIGLLTSGAISAVVATFILIIFVVILIILLKCDLKTILIKSLIIIFLLFLRRSERSSIISKDAAISFGVPNLFLTFSIVLSVSLIVSRK
jgi:hypothetical protein